MSASTESKPSWGASYRLIAAEKWKAKSAAMGRAVTKALVEYARPQAGMSVLDMATGTGEPAISMAERVGPNGQVIALDQSAELLEIAAGRARSRNLSNFSTRQADVHELPFPDEHFDLVTCRFGVMFFADVRKALQESCRVLKPGSRVCFVAWGPFDQPYWSSTMGIVHKHVGGPLLADSARNMFHFAPPGTLSAELRAAGFHQAEDFQQSLPWPWHGTIEEVWEYAKTLSTPFQPLLNRVPPEKWDLIETEVHAAIAKFVQGESVNFSATVVLASGTKQ